MAFGVVRRNCVPWLVSTAASLAFALPAVAQPAPIARTPTAQEIRREPATATAPLSKVTIDARGALNRGPCPAALLNSPLQVPLTDIVFVGASGTELPAEIRSLLAPTTRGFANSTQPIHVVCDIRDAATAALVRANYVAAVRVPEQTIAAGKLVMEVVMARIVELRVRGEPGRTRPRIEALLAKLRALSPLNTRDAEHILLLAGDIPGIAVTLELSPAASGVPGEVIGDITVQRTPGTLLLNVQNYGSRQIGRYAGLARAEVYGLTGLGDRTFLSGFTTSDFSEQQVIQAGHDMLLTSSGLRVGGELTLAWTRPSLEQFGGSIDLRSKALLATVQATYPLMRTLGTNIVLNGGFDLINQRVETGGVAINDDKLRIAFMRVSGDLTERATAGLAPRWRFGSSVELRKGTSFFNATKLGGGSSNAFPTRFEGDPEAFEVRGSFQTELRARFDHNSPYAITTAVDARGQWSNNPLLAFEEMAVGNLTIGRGYDPGATSGDRAAGASFELRIGKPQPQSRRDLAVEALAFYDAVKIWNLDSGSTENNRQLRSYGGGARGVLGRPCEA